MAMNSVMKLICAACAAVVICSAVPARAEVSSGGLARMERAFAQWSELVKKREPEGRLPMLSDPDAVKALNMSWNEQAILGDGRFTMESFDRLNAVLDLHLKMYDAYSMPPNFEEVQPSEADGQAMIAHVARYQAELAELNSFMFSLIAAMYESFDDMSVLAQDPAISAAQRDEVRTMREAIYGLVRTTLNDISDLGLSEITRTRMAVTVVGKARGIARYMQMQERAALIKDIEAEMERHPGLKPLLANAVAFVNDAPCTGSCALQ
jgi:hypothetical protein